MSRVGKSFKFVKEKNCLRHLRFSTSVETTLETNNSIIVYARVKPLYKETSLFSFTSNTIKCPDRDKKGNELLFSFHHVFSPLTSQRDVFEETVSSYVNNLLMGENRLVFAYGTSSSGKTYTLLGDHEAPGIIPRCIFKIYSTLVENIVTTSTCPDRGCDFRTLTSDEMTSMSAHVDIIEHVIRSCENMNSQELLAFPFDVKASEEMLDRLLDEVEDAPENILDPEAKYSIWVSYVEVYNENIYDLLDCNVHRKPLKLGVDSKKDTYVKGLTHLQANNWSIMWSIVLYGRSRLHVNSTQLNTSSSRSHSVFTLKLIKSLNKSQTISSLTLCDLAGTERQKKAFNQGETLQESCNINTSLMILNRCFTVVRENKLTNQNRKPPYRESKLTMILQKALSYKEPMTMFVALSQSTELYEETKNVLKMSAVAQEMIKPLPKLKDRFLKPNSRFSILCSNVTSNNNFSEISGIQPLMISTVSDTERERIEKEYQVILDDAKVEYLNLEKKLQETELKLTEEIMSYEELEKEYENLEVLYNGQVEQSRIKEQDYENKIELQEKDIEELKTENDEIKRQLEELKNENQRLMKQLAEKNLPKMTYHRTEQNISDIQNFTIDGTHIAGPLAESTFRESDSQKLATSKPTKDVEQLNLMKLRSTEARNGNKKSARRNKRALLNAIVVSEDSDN